MKTFLFICIALLFLPSYGFSPTTEGTKLNNPPSISICKADTPIQIDGLDQDWNSNDSIISINNLLSGNPSSPVDLSGQFQVKWDNSYLYVFGHVTDDSFVNDSPSPWDDDSFEIYIDGGNEKGTSYDANDHQLIFRYNDLTVHDVSGNQTNPPGIDFKLTPSNGQYDIEVRISWAFIGIATPTTGTQIGLDIHLNDDDAAILNNPGVQIPSSDWTVYFDPNDPNSYNQNRSDCQLIVAGNRFNTGDATDSYQAGTGYGLSFDANSEIHSFPADGETLRFGARPAAGLCNSPKAFVNRFVWLNDGSYDEFQEQPNGVNLSTTFPGIDRTFYDGTKNQMGCIPTSVNDPKAVKVGPGADIVRLATTWRIEDWMLAADGKGCLHNLHEPGAGSPSPLSTYLGEGGFLTIVTRDTLGPFTPGTHFKRNDRVKIPITTADIGDWWSLVYEYRIDPTGSGFLRVWLDKGDGNFQQIVNATGIIGYRFAAGSSFNEKFYPVVMIFYSWHRYTYPGVINNWDPSYGDVRELHYAFAGFMVNGTRTAQDLMNHTHYITCGGGTTTGGGTRDASIAWSDTNNAAWSTPSVFGTITLGDCGNTWIEPDVCLWLEGAYDSNIGKLQTKLLQKNLLPPRQPYHVAPWNYNGMEGLGWTASDYPAGSVDWVLVSFRTTPAASSEVAEAAGVLLEDGCVYFPNGKILDPALGTSFYVVVEHRSHIGAMSPSPVQVTGSTLSYDFRLGDGYTSGPGYGQKSSVGQNTWMLFAGDGDQVSDLNGFDINGNDKVLWGLNNGTFGSYKTADYNMDGDVNGADRIYWEYNNGVFSTVER